LIFDATTDNVARPNELIVAHWRDWCLVGDLDGGSDRMKWRGGVWLPREHKEEPAQYTARLRRSHLFPGFSSALDSAVADPFSKPVAIENLPEALAALVTNADGDGNDLTQFAKSLMRSAVKYGRSHVFIDYTAMAPGGETITVADEAAKRPRAFFKLVEAPNLIGWKTQAGPNGEPIFTEVRMHEIRTVPDGRWGEKKAEYIRVVRRDSFELWQNTAFNPPRYALTLEPGDDARYYELTEGRQASWAMVESGAFGPPGGFDSVPLVTVYTGYRRFMDAEPPLLALAETNLTHWQSSSDQRNIVHMARVPIVFATGFSPEEAKAFTISSGAAIASQNPDARLQIVEHSGAAVQVGQDDLDNLQRGMEQLGVRPHIEKSSGASATASFLNADGAATDVQAWAQAVDTALEQAFARAATWSGMTLPETFDVQIFKDYAVKIAGGNEITALQADVKEGRITEETYLKEAKRRGMYSDDLVVEDELDTLATKREEDKALGNVQETALNGAQITAGQGIVESVAAGLMPGESAKVLIANGFPAFDDAEANAMIDAAVKHAATRPTQTPKKEADGKGGMPMPSGDDTPKGGMPGQREAA
jgi:hypothetical protein